MKKTFFGSLALAAFTIGMSSCEKEQLENTLENEIAGEYANVILPSSDYQSNVSQTLETVEGCPYYVEGAIEYSSNGQVLAMVDFGDGAQDELATLSLNNQSSNFTLNQNNKASSFTKVIVSPLVKIPGCDYIVEGIIEYWKNGVLLATIDYGNGICDEWAIKSCPGEADYKFSLKEWKKKKKKKKKKK